MREELLVGVGWLVVLVTSNYPVFDVNTQMRLLLVPADARIGSIIYRIRATDSDRDYPLQFDATDYGSYVVRFDNLACNRSYSYCEANVYLERTLSPGQVFQFRVTVKDTRGDTTTLPATLHVTDARTDFEYVFPHIPGVINVPEDLPVGTELDYVVVRRNPRSIRPAVLELWGSPKFKFYQNNKRDTTTGVIKLIEPLDYEEKSMYKLNIYATGMYVDLETDSRNIAGFPLVVVVTDIQDTPPVWDHIEPVTKLNKDIKKGDKVLKVTARDGDKGSPRRVKYGLVSENNPFTVFFTIDQDTGDISLVRELSELKSISVTGQPILLTVLAEEVVVGKGQPQAMSSTATVALLLEQLNNTPPYFPNQLYVAYLDENSIQGTQIVFKEPYVAEVKDNDQGKQGVFSLELQNNNGTFEISPTVAEREVQFVISVRDNKMLDYEVNKELSFTIVARELNPEGKALSSATNVTVYIRDVNDNPPVFIAPNYTAVVPENITYGSQVITVKAMDVDTGEGGVIKYTHIFGDKNNSLAIHPESGLITIASKDHGFDREQAQSYEFKVEARDGRGTGNSAVVPFLLKVLDVNDNAPQFDKLPIEFILGPDGSNFSQRAYITATDKDAEPPNNQVRYEIVRGNYGGKFLLDGETGELTVNPAVPRLRRQSAAKRNSTQQQATAQTNIKGTDSEPMRYSALNNESKKEELTKLSPLMDGKPKEEELKKNELNRQSNSKIGDTKERQVKSEVMWESSLKNGQSKDEVSARNGKSLQLTLLDSNLTEPMDNTTLPESRQAKRTPFVKMERQLEDSMTILRVRAYDMGVPTQWMEADVRIWPGQSGSRVLRFIVPGSSPDWRQVERMLSELTGGRVIIHDIVPYSTATNSYYQSYTDLTQGSPDSDKSIVTATVLYHSNAVIDLDKFQTSLSKNNRTRPLAPTQPPESVRIVRSESTVLFWVIILLLLLLLLLFLLFLLCCFCPGCPFYNYWNRKKTPLLQEKEHIAYISAPARDKENKSIQAEWAESARKEAWSPAVMSNRALRVRNTDQRVILMAPIDNMHRRQPSIIQMGSLQGRAQNDLILEDIDGTEYRIVDPARIAMRAPSLPLHERDDESLRRHEYERGSDRYESHVEGSVRDGYMRDKPPTRDQMFIRDGGAEILRLVTRGREDDRESEVRLNQPERPYTKEHRRLRDHGEHHRKDSEYTRDSYTEDYAKSQSRPRGSPYTKESKGSPAKEQSIANGDVSRRHDFEKEHFGHEGNATEKGSVEKGSLERGSLERASLREKHHTHGGFATRESNPYITNRPYTNEDLKESSGKEVIMRRFIEDQVSSHSHRARLEEERGQREPEHEVESSKDNRSVQSIMRTNNVIRKRESHQEDDDAAFKRIMNTRETLLTTADVNKLTTIQRDLLLARFLVEEQKRIVNRESNAVDDTQSLPGGVVGVAMATQTDVDTGTQTDRIYFVKRRAKSDNDDSGSDDDEYHAGHRRFRKKKTIVVVDPDSVKPRRNRRLCETFKSPIMEESENIEIFNGFIPTKTSTLREAAIREKFNLREDRRHHHHHHVPRAHQKETFYIMKSISDQDLNSITKHREDVLSSLEKTQVHKINIPNNIHREDLKYDERSKSSLSIHDVGGDNRGNFQDITEVYRGVPESTISAPPTHRYLTDTIASLSKKSPTRYGEKKIVAAPQARYMDWYDKDIKNKDKPLVKKPSSSIQPTRRKVSDPVPKKRAIKRSDYEMIKRELLKTEKIPAFTIQPDDPLDSKQDSPQDRNNSKRNSIQINQKPEDHDSGIAMPFASLPPAITAVTLPGDDQEELVQDDFVPMMNERNDEMNKEIVLPPT